MISFPVFLLAKEVGTATEWATVQLNGQPHLAVFSTHDKATAFDSQGRCAIRQIPGPHELRDELLRFPKLPCVIDYVAGKGTQRALGSELLLRFLWLH